MVDSSPSDGVRDGDRPTDGTDRPTDESDATDETDDQWAAVIEALAARVDPVPEAVLQAARRALHARGEKRSPEDPGAGDPSAGETES